MLISGNPLTIFLSLLFSVVATLASGAPLNDAQDVGNYIFIDRYDQTYGSGTLPKDWCFKMEHDSITKDWWYMETPPNGPLVPVYDRLSTTQYSDGPGAATIG